MVGNDAEQNRLQNGSNTLENEIGVARERVYVAILIVFRCDGNSKEAEVIKVVQSTML